MARSSGDSAAGTADARSGGQTAPKSPVDSVDDPRGKRKLSHLSGLDGIDPSTLKEEAWIDIIRKMDAVYADVIRYEEDLEAKNQELETTQAFIRSVLTSMSDMLIVCDGEGLVQEANHAAERLTGFSATDLQGKTIETLLAEGWVNLSERLRDGQQAVTDVEVRFRRADGLASDLVALNCSLRLDPLGQPAGMVLIGRAIGELQQAYRALNRAHADLQQAQAQLVQQEKMASLGRLIAGVAHELNNPISFVAGNVHTLNKYRMRLESYLKALHQGRDPGQMESLRRELRIDFVLEDLESLIDGTLEGAERVSELVRNLRRLSFSPGGDASDFNLSNVVRNPAQWAIKGDKSAIASRAAVKLDLPETLILRGYEGQLHQVIVNLVSNALYAIRNVAEPVITIKGRQMGDAIELDVADNGSGINAADMDKVFDPFFTTKRVGEGTGLGLWITYGIVREHKGTMMASNGPDGGAVFTLALPRRGPESIKLES